MDDDQPFAQFQPHWDRFAAADAADDLVYRNHVNAAIDQLRLALRTTDTGERIRLLTGALANTGNAIGQLAQFDSDGRARPPRK